MISLNTILQSELSSFKLGSRFCAWYLSSSSVFNISYTPVPFLRLSACENSKFFNLLWGEGILNSCDLTLNCRGNLDYSSIIHSTDMLVYFLFSTIHSLMLHVFFYVLTSLSLSLSLTVQEFSHGFFYWVLSFQLFLEAV